MTSPNYGVRRATVDDLAELRTLWSSMHFPADLLEKRLTEFQVVLSPEGRVVGALGIQMIRQQAALHSEAFEDFAVADDLRALLLERIRALASNHGVLRLWTREKSPFWSYHGFRPADAELLKKLPEPWAGGGSDWLTVQLKDEDAIASLEKEVALLMQTEKQRTARLSKHAHTLKSISTLVAITLAIFVVYAVVYLVRKNSEFLHFGR